MQALVLVCVQIGRSVLAGIYLTCRADLQVYVCECRVACVTRVRSRSVRESRMRSSAVECGWYAGREPALRMRRLWFMYETCILLAKMTCTNTNFWSAFQW